MVGGVRDRLGGRVLVGVVLEDAADGLAAVVGDLLAQQTLPAVRVRSAGEVNVRVEQGVDGDGFGSPVLLLVAVHALQVEGDALGAGAADRSGVGGDLAVAAPVRPGPFVLRCERVVVVVPGTAAVGVGVLNGGVGDGCVVDADGGDAVLVEPVDRRVLVPVDVPVLRVAGAGVCVRCRVQGLAARALR